MTSSEVPSWLCTKEEYVPKKDSSTFVKRSEKAMIKLLSGIKRKSISPAKEDSTSLRLFGLLLTLLLTSAAKNFSFVLLMLALTAVSIATLNGEKIKALLQAVLPATGLSFLILLPSLFLGHPKTMLSVVTRVFVCVSLVMRFRLSRGEHAIILALKRFHVPDILLFTFDLTIKYIILLGECCAQLLTALKIRSIGKNRNKEGAASGILGTVFIKAKTAAEETNKAMECRGFSGSYVVRKEKKKFTAWDAGYLCLLILLLAGFIYLEVAL